MEQLYATDWEDHEIKVRLCETCGAVLGKNEEKCIFCGKDECWNCKLRCMYEHHRKEVKE